MNFLLHVPSIACISPHSVYNKNCIFFFFLHSLFQVDFDQFKNALILVLSSTIEPAQEEQETVSTQGNV